MYLSWKQRRNQWAVEVTYASGVVREFGPIRYKEQAVELIETRMVPAGQTSPRAVEIRGARVVRFRRKPWGPWEQLLGVRFVIR